MRVRESQNFLSLYFEPNAVETAVGGMDPHTHAEDWERETKSLGQVPTPPQVAQLMARWVMSANPSTVLDPAAGLGSLLHECHRIDRRAKLVGIERDSQTLVRAKSTAPCGSKLVLADYLLSDAGQFNGIIANPPYVKAHRLNYSEANWRAFEERLGTPLDRLTNIYALFLLKIWEDLAPHGRAAIILPAEFLNANFGEEIKERLTKELRPPGIIVFNPEISLFEDSLTTSAIVLLERGRPKSAFCRLAKANTLSEAQAFVNELLTGSTPSKGLAHQDLNSFKPCDKWLNTILNNTGATRKQALPNVIGDYFDCRRGIATGANDYFCLSKSDLEQNGLELDHVNPCIAKATDASGLVFTLEKFSALAAANRRCYLLNPRHNGPALATYLKAGELAGIRDRHLPSHRPVWYLPENRAVADIWIAVFSRESAKFILNTSGAKNLTCFHGLYAKEGHKSKAALTTLYLNSGWGRDAFGQVNRFYGDGLNKLEPKDVEALPCPKLPNLSDKQTKEILERLSRLDAISSAERNGQIDEILPSFLDLPSRRTV